ncbi:prolyl oligopeptidase family serine peptidase [Flavobacterium azooxidireducens]|uniref:Prolyl oligopeptidase family serine peptidase n=1 Tax=Flavobacterium azooxidireducens TaxID=1871076 RepID=A0ABY4KIS0_9FLAO|nr:prolyl oligopeptidase family serine peptidase [Flavobacterium azooxidireducens]UPQ80569.1 prolyl oligopeptidase family serine peptidase [Flavobacterium azooxidireducens]
MKYYASVFAFLLFQTIFSQILSLPEIMKGDEFIGHQPENHRWSIDGSTLYFDWNPKNEKGNSTYFWKKGMKSPQLLQKDISFTEENFEDQKQFNEVFYIQNGNLFSYDKKTKTHKKVIVSSGRISNLQRSDNPKLIFFQQNNNIFQLDLTDFSMIQLTNFKQGKESEKKEKENFLINQQKELFQFVNDQEALKEWNKSKSESNEKAFPKEFFYDKVSMEQLTPSPNGKFVTFRQSDYPTSNPTKVEQFITADGYTKNTNARAKVSTENFSKHKFGIYSVEKDSVAFVSFSNLTGISEFPKYYQEYNDLKDKEKTEKAIVMQAPVFNEDGTLAVFEIRSQDNKDRWIVQLDLNSATITELDHQHDEAWIDGPGIPGYAFSRGTLGFLKDNQTIYFQSEASGFSHLYLMNLKNKKKTQLTKGNWEVRNVKPSIDGKSFYITTNTTHPGNREFYKLDITSQKMTPILTKEGAHEVEISPDEKTLLVRYSSKNKPWELYVADNKPNTTLEQITFSTTKTFDNYPWKSPEVITFKAKDGTDVYARIYEPKPEIKNKAAIIFVHGAGYLQNAHNFWSSYHREYMFHNLLTDLGYTVLDIDYRGSDGYGRNVRTGIYRHMGGLDLEDHLDGKQFLVSQKGINETRVGIYGGSYGGFITLMALLTQPGEFKAGAALRSVTDWAHYNHGYTGNILNFPETDPKAYQKSSPIYFADKLQDKLLMMHGMVDNNVQFQDVVRLSQRFIELGKKDWDLAVYPVESHGFKETYSWVDEYTRILNLFNESLLKKD